MPSILSRGLGSLSTGAGQLVLLTACHAAGPNGYSQTYTALEGLRSSLLWKSLSFLEQKSLIRARELPLLVAGDSEIGLGPIDGHVGTLDLLYQDPENGRLVVADFKSDAVADEAAIPKKDATYRSQLELYGRAVREALALSEPPRLELWFLSLDRIAVIPSRR